MEIGSIEILKELFSVAMVEIIFVIVVFKLVLSNYQPPIQQSIQAVICIVIGVTLAMVVDPNVHSFMTGCICAGLGFYGGTYVDEIRGIKREVENDDKTDDKKTEEK